MTHLHTRLAVRAFLALVSPTVAHASDEIDDAMKICKALMQNSSTATCARGNIVIFVSRVDWTCVPDYKTACQQRDQDADGLRRSEQGR